MTTYTCPKCNEIYDVVAWEKILGPFYGLCPDCYEKAHLERILAIDHIAKGRQIKEETKCGIF